MSRNRVATREPKANKRIEDLNLSRPFSSISKATPKILPSAIPGTKKSSENIREKTVQNSVSNRLSGTRLVKPAVGKEKHGTEKISTIKSIQTIGQRNMKTMRERSVPTKTVPKNDVGKETSVGKAVETKSNKARTKVRKTDSKVSGTSVKTANERPNLAKQKSGTTISRNEKSAAARLAHGKSKTKEKSKKIGQSKSTILRPTADHLGLPCPIRDDNYNLADLIEASLKNIRNPRSIFNDDFSCIQRKPYIGDTAMQEEFRRITDLPRGMKNSGLRTTLDRLSEKSEPLTAKSKSSVKKSDAQRSATAKSTKVRTKKSAESTKGVYTVTTTEEKLNFEHYKIFDKYPTPRIDGVEQKAVISQSTIDKMELLRSLGSNNLSGQTVALSRGLKAPFTNGSLLDRKKTVGHMHKDQQNTSTY